MQALKSVPFIAVEEYLAREREAEYKSEYFDGEIFAMAGASEPHVLIVNSIIARLYLTTRASPLQGLFQ
jgi:Uma2 family endonuclease